MKHGHAMSKAHPTASPTYRSWQSMRKRCKDAANENYGARGIAVCKRWENFENFLADMGKRPSNKTLDRIDFSKGYSPKNCRWATSQEQCRNMRVNRVLLFQGQRKCLTEWAETLGIHPETVRTRLNRGWSTTAALSREVRRYG